MSLQTVSWMSVMVGDPLYRPFAAWLNIEGQKPASPWRAYHDFATANGSRPPAEFRTAARQLAIRSGNAPMLEDLGLMEVRDGNLAGALGYFQQARTVYTQRDDIIRVVLHEADVLIKQNKQKRALELVRSVLKISSDATLLKKLESELAAPPQSASPGNPRRP